MKKEHGLHNEQLNDKLVKEGLYKDWIVTTAFYSSIHFIDHKVFPCTYNGVHVKNLEEAFIQVRKINPRISKHKTRGVMVAANLPKINIQYIFLQKQSGLARYINYNVPDLLAKQAKEYLNKIKKECGC